MSRERELYECTTCGEKTSVAHPGMWNGQPVMLHAKSHYSEWHSGPIGHSLCGPLHPNKVAPPRENPTE